MKKYNETKGFSISEPVGKEERQNRASVKERSKKIVRWMWYITGIGVAVVLLFLLLIYNGIIGYMPPIEELKNPHASYASIIYSANGSEMGRYYRNTGNRVYADFDEISPIVVDALIATEDARFREHSGIDMRAMSRVLLKTILMGQSGAGGGSTITQQLAKQLYSNPTDSKLSRAFQKPIEWMIAVKLERFYSKEEIIKMYLNQFDFLYNAVGIQSAAHVYFNKKASDLNIQEAALLVGMVKNPSLYNPRLHPVAALQRRNVVLEQMEKAGLISQAQFESISALPIELDFHRVDHKDGVAPYFREELRRYLTAKKPEKENYPSWDYRRFVTDSTLWENNPLYGWVLKNPKADGSLYDIYADGLKIYTTIDTTMQAYAEQSLTDQLRELQKRFDHQKKGTAAYPYTANQRELPEAQRQKLIKAAMRQSERGRIARLRGIDNNEFEKEFNTPVPMTLFSWRGPVDTVMTPLDSIIYTKGILRAGFMAMDPRSGYVKAYVGGPDFKFFQYDMVSIGKRQVGSTMKPFLYTLAMEDGLTPCTMMPGGRPVFRLANGGTWSPRGGGGAMTIKEALTRSNNAISARLIDQVGPRRFADYMKSFGVTTKLPPVPSLCLGPAEISLLEMVSAYSAFANEGMRVDPIFVRAIADSDGNIISRFSPNQTEVISHDAYYRILSMLLNVVDAGTGRRIRARFGINAEMGGKTGTTNHNADGWFMAFTPSLVAGAWVGGEERYIHFNMTSDGQGAEMALPITGRFLKRVYDNKSLGYSQTEKFAIPPDFEFCPQVEEFSEGGTQMTVDDSIFD